MAKKSALGSTKTTGKTRGPKFTAPTWPPALLATFQVAVYQAFDACAYDILSAVAEDSGKDINRVSIPRDEAIEVGIDADRWQQYVRNPADRVAIRKLLDATPYDAMIALCYPRFQSARYGL